MKRFFITATGTDIGKTFITAALTCQLRSKGMNVKAIKPVLSGFDSQNPAGSDAGILLAAQGLPLTELDNISPWRFAAPLSPDMAATLENQRISLEAVSSFCEQQQDAEVLFIEGAGGIMTPINNQHTMLDLIKILNIAVILVTGSYVGTLSHTLTALKVVSPHSVIINESVGSAASLQQTHDALRNHVADSMNIRTIQRLDNRPEIWKYAPNITEGLL